MFYLHVVFYEDSEDLAFITRERLALVALLRV